MIWLIGSGGMAVDYVKVLNAQKEDFLVIGRGDQSASEFETVTGKSVIRGGLEKFLTTSPEIPAAVIVSVGVEELFNTSMRLLAYGVGRLLVEKPGGLSIDEIEIMQKQCVDRNAAMYIAYNRRFFSSVLKAQDLIKMDGGVTSFNFELTEWSHVIETLNKKTEVLNTWFIGNTTHVADLAFFLGGKPTELSSYTSGTLAWHPKSSIFSGAGVTESGALFNYGADWESAGRWSVEMLTKEYRYIFRPMETLQIQKRGTVQICTVEVDDELHKKYKPGLYLQVKAFLTNDPDKLCSIDEQLTLFPVYEKMASYSS